MFKFEKEQMIFEIGGVKVGGQPGENPTVMIGSIFYKGDKFVQDERTGTFDRKGEEKLITELEEASDRFGLPAMIDVVCANPEVTEKYLEFVANATSMPILIDYVSEEAAIEGMNCAKELRIIDRTILNSINPETKESIYGKIREVGLESAIVLTYSSKAVISSKERVKLLDSLMPKVKAAGIRKFLIDTVVIDVATLGLACKAIYEVKGRFGYPAGCGAHNAIASWRALKDKKDKVLTMVCSSIVNGLPIALGADFVLYGPIRDAEYIFPAVALIEAAYGQVMMEEGKRPSQNHPRFKISHI
jgi:tetrahydromethanopterin S-methyltransferase subunit H